MNAIELKEITKQFHGIKANDAVSLRVESGSIHAIVGENGAGKSTAMNIVYGVHRPDHGEVLVNGTAVRMSSPADAIRNGIGMVHQHFMLIPRFTVAENVILGAEGPKGAVRLDMKRAETNIRALSEEYQLPVNPSAMVGTLSISGQQRVELLKLLYRRASILILDEPTPVLTPQEIDALFQTLRNIRSEGRTVIIITHKLGEVMNLTDQVTVMRQGKVVISLPTARTTIQELARMMVGRDRIPTESHRSSPSSVPVLRTDHLCVDDPGGRSAVRDVSLEVHRGEILGIAGVEGNGQAELVGAIAGLLPVRSGSCTVDGLDVADHPPIAHIPEDRLGRGVIGEFSVQDNLLLGRQRDRRFFQYFGSAPRIISKDTAALIGKFDIRLRSPGQPINSLSGGNQQKVVLARELSKNATLIIAHQPTRGLDIGAIEYVHGRILAERNGGRAILLVSSDLEELLTLSDRIAVFFDGHVAACCIPSKVSERDLGLYMSGARVAALNPTDPGTR